MSVDLTVPQRYPSNSSMVSASGSGPLVGYTKQNRVKHANAGIIRIEIIRDVGPYSCELARIFLLVNNPDVESSLLQMLSRDRQVASVASLPDSETCATCFAKTEESAGDI